MLHAERITQGYGRTTVLHSLDITLEPGVTALLGPNGAGKTTLLRTLATVQPPWSGRLVIGGLEVDSEATARTARRQIGYLPQRPAFDPAMSVRDFVTYGAWIRGVAPREWAAACGQALEYVGLADVSRRKMGSLSGGMRQRAGIAWAVVGRPSLILLDEPTVGLDPQQRLLFRELIGGLSDTIVLLSTHLTDDVDAVCADVLVMDRGAVVFRGPTEGLRARARAGEIGHTPLERGYMSVLAPEGSVA